MHKFFEISGIIFWSDIGTSVIFSHPGDEDLRKIFFSNFEIDITVVSFEETIVFRIISFDEIVLKIERF